MKANERLEVLASCLSAIGGADGVFKNLEKTEAILFIRDMSTLANLDLKREKSAAVAHFVGMETMELVKILADRTL